MATRMQQRRGTAAQWISTNQGNGPILAPGELGWESDTNKFKVGDGVNHWIDLDYFTTDSAQAVTDQINTAISNLVDGAPGLLDTLNELAAAINDDPTFFTTIATNLSDHTSATTNIHGILDTNELATKDYVTTQIGNSTVDQSVLAGVGIDWNATTEAFDIDSTVATKDFAAQLLTNATKTNITITGDKNGLTITAENGVDDSNTDNLTEGSSNLYFTNERAQDAVGNAVGTGLTYTDSTGEIKVTPNTYDAYGAASTAETNAKSYADGLASNYDASGTATSAISTHNSDTTNVHGISDTSALATKTYADNAADAAETAAAGYTDTAIANLVDGAPALLNTLNELAAAINDDASIADTLTTAIGTKVSKAGDVMTGSLTLPGAPTSNLHAATKAYVDTTAGTAQQNAKDYADGLAVNYDASGAALSAYNNAKDYADGLASNYDAAGAATAAETAAKNYADGLASNYDASGAADAAETAANLYTDGKISTEVTDRNSAISTVINNLTTSDIEEGSNLYFTDERAQDAIGLNVGTGLTYTDSTGEIKVTPNTYDAYGSASTVAGDLSTHISDTTAHGTTGDVVGTSDTQILTNKTIDTANNNITVVAADISDVTATASEINILDGATLSTIELNYVDGVTSSIQDQLDDKAPLASPTFTGDAVVDNLEISGALTFSGTATQIDQTNLTISDPLIYLAEGNTANINDLGFVASYNDGTYAHTGLAKDASTGVWKLFKGVTDEPTNTVNFTQGSLDDLQVAGLTASSLAVGDVSNTEIGYLNGVTSAIQNQIDGKQEVVSGVSSTEIGYLDGVTSAIQTQIDSKSPTASPTFTGTVTVPNGSILGTPTSVTLTNATGLPVSTGISGLGTGVATFLATPTSANLASAVTGETGSGALVFGSSPTLKGPVYLQSAGGAGGSANYIDVNNSNGTLSLVSGYPLALTATGNITLTATGGAAKVGSDTIATLTATQTLTGKTISGADNTLSNIGNSSLTNSKVTVGTTDISLGASSTTLAGLTSVTSTSFTGALTGNASTVTNGVYTTDSGTVTNGMLAGSIANSKLANSEITINGTTVSLGGSISGLATLSSPALTGTPTAPTQAAGDNSTKIATTAYADASAAAAAAAIVASAPSTLDTLNELASALGNDANYATTITTALGNKQDKVSGVSDTEIGYLDGVTSAIQTQLDAKLDSTTASTTYQTIVSGVSDIEIGYLDGVTSAIQTQLDSKLDSSTAASTYAPTSSPTFTGTVNFTGATVTGIDSLPSQTGNTGKYLTTDGTTASWGTVSTGSSGSTIHPVFAMA